MQITTVDPHNAAQAAEAGDEAAAVLRRGGLVVFPTETVYGVAASIDADDAVARLRSLKGDEGALAIHLASPRDADRFLPEGGARLRRVARKLLAGPVTVAVALDEDAAAARLREAGVTPEQMDRVYQHGTILLRCPDHPVASRMLEAADGLVVAGGAGKTDVAALSGEDQPLQALQEAADHVVDAGPTRYARSSTRVRLDVVKGAPVVRVEKEGVYDARTIERLSRYTVLIVCSGNTCRSPMAEAIAKQKLAAARRLRVDELEAAGLRVRSAGVFAAPGMPASAEAVTALAEKGIDLSGHRSTPLSRQLLDEADVVYGLTEGHVRAVVDLSASAADRVMRLDAKGDVPDPIGADLATYHRTADAIGAALDARLKEIG